MKLHFERWCENRLVFRIARKKIHQNFLASKYDVKKPSDTTYFGLFRTFLLNILFQLLKMNGLKYICILFEFKHTEFFTSHRGYLLDTTL